jgi:hypothetical protein
VISALPLEALLVAADVEDAKEEREKEINSSPGTRIKSMQQPRSNRGNRGEERRGEERSDFINNESTELILVLVLMT